MYYYVYILQSIKYPENYYTGFTNDIKKRIVKHNNGEVLHTSKYKPWRIKNVIFFIDKDKALAFEKYLKSHSGRAFAKKHF
jgi:predicted GIY-YIG superfamily endonuclease